MNKLLKIAVPAILCVLWSCARVQAPPGGPPDTTPPAVVSTTPPQRTTNFTDETVVFALSEYVERSAVQNNIFISPPVEYEIDWSGRDLEIEFLQPLESRTTYAVTLGTEFADRSGNKPQQAYTLIFSTGDNLDSGVIRGRVIAEKPEGTFVFLYPLAGSGADTLNPAVTRPKYRTQIGATGAFEFQALPPGAYRLLAVGDEFRNSVFDLGTDAFGTTFDPLVLDEGGVRETAVRLGPALDNTAPEVYGATALAPTVVRVEFSEALDTSSVTPAAFTLAPAAGGPAPAILSAFLSPSRRFSVHIVTQQPLDPAVEWQVTALSVRDSAGTTVSDTARSTSFSVADAADTIAPTLVEAPFADSTSGIGLAGPFRFVWSTALDSAASAAAVRLQRVDSTVVPVELRRPMDNIIDIVPRVPLAPDAAYVITINAGRLRDVSGAAGRDTTILRRFSTVDPGNYGIVAGTLVDSAGGSCRYVLTLASKDGRHTFRKVLLAPGAWEFTDVPPGSYTISAFCDADGNGVYSYGEAFPYRFAERFFDYAQEIVVRPRWTMENVRLVIP